MLWRKTKLLNMYYNNISKIKHIQIKIKNIPNYNYGHKLYYYFSLLINNNNIIYYNC